MEDHEVMTVAESHQELVTRVLKAMRERRLFGVDVARQIGMSQSVVSLFLAGTYRGNKDAVAGRLRLWLAGLESADWLNASMERSREFVETPTAKTIIEVCRFVKARGVIGVVAGSTGVGKTRTLKQMPKLLTPVWYVEFTCRDGKSLSKTLKAIAEAVRVHVPAYQGASLERTIAERLERTRGLLVLDEAQHLSPDVLEAIRSIYDLSEDDEGRSAGIVLAGHLDLRDKVAALPHLEGRIGRAVIFPTATEADVNALCDLWELDCAQARAFLRARARDRSGLRRIAKVHELALSLAAGEASPVTIDHVRSAWHAFSGAAAN